MEEPRWRRATEADNLRHCPDVETKNAFYARIYTAKQGHAYSETNQLILNLKKSPLAKPSEIHYKNIAIEKFCEEATQFFESLSTDRKIFLVPVPPSKLRNAPEFDDRLEKVAQCIERSLKDVRYFPALRSSKELEPAHLGGPRNPEDIKDTLTLDEKVASVFSPRNLIIILDDVLTSGAHYEAARQLLLQRFPDTLVAGVFWAKAKNVPA